METQARYTLIGLFTLAVIGAGFLFVYWLNTAGGFGARAMYAVRYDGSVAGLLKGSSVLFNGVRVGEVTGLRLDAARPEEVLVDIAVERPTPVRADTRVGIDFQGLTGSPVVALYGGSPKLPLLLQDPSRPAPILVSEKNAGQSMMQAARDVLRKLDGVVGDNSEPVKSLIANIDKFAGALGRNTERVDGIFAGLERLTGGGAKTPPRFLDLTVPKSFPGLAKVPAAQLLVQEPTALSMIDSERVAVVRVDPGEAPSLAGGQWPDMLPKVLQARIVQSFEAAGYMRVLARVPEGTRSDFKLLLDIRSFHLSARPSPTAEVEIAARLINAEGGVVESRVFRETRALASLDPEAAVKGLNEAFGKVAAELVVWACGLI